MTAIPRCLRCEVEFDDVYAFIAHRGACKSISPDAASAERYGQGRTPLPALPTIDSPEASA